MARATRPAQVTPAKAGAAGKPASGAQGPRVRPRRSRSAKATLTALLAHVEALDARLAAGTGSQQDATIWALRYLDSGRPTQLPGQSQAGLSDSERAKLADAQADVVAGVITKVLDGMGLTDAQFEAGMEVAMKVLREASSAEWWPL
jgi:hypothetical protein